MSWCRFSNYQQNRTVQPTIVTLRSKNHYFSAITHLSQRKIWIITIYLSQPTSSNVKANHYLPPRNWRNFHLGTDHWRNIHPGSGHRRWTLYVLENVAVDVHGADNNHNVKCRNVCVCVCVKDDTTCSVIWQQFFSMISANVKNIRMHTILFDTYDK